MAADHVRGWVVGRGSPERNGVRRIKAKLSFSGYEFGVTGVFLPEWLDAIIPVDVKVCRPADQ